MRASIFIYGNRQISVKVHSHRNGRCEWVLSQQISHEDVPTTLATLAKLRLFVSGRCVRQTTASN